MDDGHPQWWIAQLFGTSEDGRPLYQRILNRETGGRYQDLPILGQPDRYDPFVDLGHSQDIRAALQVATQELVVTGTTYPTLDVPLAQDTLTKARIRGTFTRHPQSAPTFVASDWPPGIKAKRTYIAGNPLRTMRMGLVAQARREFMDSLPQYELLRHQYILEMSKVSQLYTLGQIRERAYWGRHIAHQNPEVIPDEVGGPEPKKGPPPDDGSPPQMTSSSGRITLPPW